MWPWRAETGCSVMDLFKVPSGLNAKKLEVYFPAARGRDLPSAISGRLLATNRPHLDTPRQRPMTLIMPAQNTAALLSLHFSQRLHWVAS